MISKLEHGNTYALKARDGRNVVQALYILDPTRVRVLVAPDGSVFYELHIDELSRITTPIVVPAREMMHRNVRATLSSARRRVADLRGGLARNARAEYPAHVRHVFQQRVASLAACSRRLGKSRTRRRTAVAILADNFSGDNIGKVAVLGDGLKYEAMAMTAEQSELVAQLNMTDEDICKAFHMPRWKVGVGPDPPYGAGRRRGPQHHLLFRLPARADRATRTDPGRRARAHDRSGAHASASNAT